MPLENLSWVSNGMEHIREATSLPFALVTLALSPVRPGENTTACLLKTNLIDL